MRWKTIERPGYLGKKRDRFSNECNKKYGTGNWRIAYSWANRIVERPFALQLYEDSYFEFFKNNKEVLSWLLMKASDVYDTAESNTKSELDYGKQETIANHIQDIAIRRAILRLGKWFQGNELFQIRKCNPESDIINPGKVPFHLPEFIAKEQIEKYNEIWWEQNTIEDFYQRNKVLQIRL